VEASRGNVNVPRRMRGEKETLKRHASVRLKKADNISTKIASISRITDIEFGPQRAK